MQSFKKGNKMSRIIAMLLLVSVMSVATTALAGTKDPNLNVVSSLEVANVITNTAVTNTSAKSNSQTYYNVSSDKEISDLSFPAKVWLLLSALIGFVLLSNRWSV